MTKAAAVHTRFAIAADCETQPHAFSQAAFYNLELPVNHVKLLSNGIPKTILRELQYPMIQLRHPQEENALNCCGL